MTSTDRPRDQGKILAAIAIREAASWKLGRAGAIVCDCPADCPDHDDDNERFYGGHFVAESVHPAIADFIISKVCPPTPVLF